ncbi:MAG: hypothetical protein S4CHLAM2_02970 [Chlamydiales bacterium]|nr:hypothetical protein [Chlamydiales bacterium]
MSTPALAERQIKDAPSNAPVTDVKIKDSCLLFVLAILATLTLAVVGYQLGSSLYLSGGISAAVLGTLWVAGVCALYFATSR